MAELTGRYGSARGAFATENVSTVAVAKIRGSQAEFGLERHRKLNGREAVVARLHHGGSRPSDRRPLVHCL